MNSTYLVAPCLTSLKLSKWGQTAKHLGVRTGHVSTAKTRWVLTIYSKPTWKKKDVPIIMIPRSLHFINGITKEWKAKIISWYSGKYQFLPCYSQVQLIKIVRCWFYRGDLNPHRKTLAKWMFHKADHSGSREPSSTQECRWYRVSQRWPGSGGITPHKLVILQQVLNVESHNEIHLI